MMHVIISENLFDADYVARYTMGFEDLKARAQQYPPEKVAQWTGISADDIRKLAREYATVRPSVIRVNYGIQRSRRRRHGDARRHHAALSDRVVEGNRRRAPALDQRRFRLE